MPSLQSIMSVSCKLLVLLQQLESQLGCPQHHTQRTSCKTAANHKSTCHLPTQLQNLHACLCPASWFCCCGSQSRTLKPAADSNTLHNDSQHSASHLPAQL
jgi:hypothetical protein